MTTVRYIPNPRLQTEYEHSSDAWRVMDEYGDEVADRARAMAPVDTGALRDSIESKRQPSVRGGAGFAVEAGVDYAVYVEFGTSVMDAEPYLRPALDEVL